MMKNKRAQKVLSVLLSLSMVCVMLLALSGCGSQNDLVGNWESSVDFTDLFNDSMLQAMDDEEVAEYVTVDKLSLNITMSLQEDGTYSLGLDEDSARQAMEGAINTVKDGIKRYFEKMIADQDLDMSVDDFFTSMIGSDFDSYISEYIDMDDLMSNFEGIEENGTYKVSGTVLTLTSDAGEVEYTFELNGSELTLDGDDDTGMNLFPMTFQKK